MNRERIAEAALGAGDLQIFHGRARASGQLQEQAKQAKLLRASLCALQQQARDLHDRALSSSEAAGVPISPHSEGTTLADIERDLHPFLNLWRVMSPHPNWIQDALTPAKEGGGS